MTALLRYLLLKSWRDSSLITFLIVPMLVPVAALAGVTLANGHLQYPFYMNVQYTPVQNATLVAAIAMATASLFASISAFWALRPEIANRSVGAFFFAARPLTVALTLILFGAALAWTAWIGALAIIGALTSALPANLLLATLRVAAGCLAASAAGALVVTISPQPAMIVASYFGCVVLIPMLAKSKGSVQLLVALVVAMVCTALSAFLLERRCAT